MANNPRNPQQGAVLVETAITLALFMLIIMAIFELALLISEWSRSVEATRRFARELVVSDAPVALDSLDCTVAGASISFDCGSQDCGPAWTRASRLAPTLAGSSMHVTYSCSSASYPERPEEMPVLTLTVELRDHTTRLAIPGLIGMPVDLTIPGFRTSRITEDMHTPGGE